MFRQLSLLLIFALLPALALSQEPSSAPSNEGGERFEVGQELFFSGILDRFRLGETFAIKNENEIYIELESFINVLDFPIRVDGAGRRFSGWFSKEENTFLFTMAEDGSVSVVVRGQEQQVNSTDVKLEFGSVYVDTSALTAWFGIDFKIDYMRLELRYVPREPLPLQRKLARQSQRIYANNQNESVFPELARGYEILSPQLVDVFASGIYGENTKDLRGIYSAIGVREIAQHNVRFTLNGSDAELLREGALSVSKTSRNKDLLGFLGASRYEFGDITPVQIGNLGTSSRSVGVRIQNTDSSQRFNRQTTSINGDVQLGWDVELYRNGVLLAQLFDVESNRYEFNDVDLLFGNNEFEIVLYGPQGQIIRESKTEILDDATLGTEQWAYQASIVRLNDSLFNNADSNNDSNLVAGLSLGRNVGEHSSIDFGFQTGLDTDELSYVSAGFNSRIMNNLLFNTNVDSNLDDLISVSGSLRTSLAGQSITFSSSFRNTKGTDEQDDTQVLSTALNVAGSLEGIGLRSISYTADVGYSDDGSRSSVFSDSSIRWSTDFGSFFYNLNYEQAPELTIVDPLVDPLTDSRVESNDRLTGGFGYQGTIGPVFTRINASYDASDAFEVSAVSGSFTYNPTANIRTRLQVTRNLITDLTNYNLNLTWRHDQVSLGAEARYSDLAGYSLGLNTRFSFGGLPYNNEVFATRDSLSSNGSIAVRVFEDLNSNAEYDLGEPLIPDVEVHVSATRTKQTTNEDGIALLQNLSVTKPTDIRLENKNEDEPFLMPIIEGVAIQPREGFIDRLDFPMVQGSEIEGSIYLPGQDKKPAAFAKIFLKKRDSVVRTIEPEFDGYFLLTEIPPGHYTIELEKAYAKENEYEPMLSKAIYVTNESKVLVLEDLVIKKLPFEDGYIVNLGLYTNRSLANAQALLFKKRLANLRLPQTLEVIRLAEEGAEKFVVAAAVLRDARIGHKYCQFLAKESIECSLIDYRIRIPI